MRQCWLETPVDRPNFTDLRVQLELLLSRDRNYLELDNINVPLSTPESSSGSPVSDDTKSLLAAQALQPPRKLSKDELTVSTLCLRLCRLVYYRRNLPYVCGSVAWSITCVIYLMFAVLSPGLLPAQSTLCLRFCRMVYYQRNLPYVCGSVAWSITGVIFLMFAVLSHGLLPA
ncbi:hypothetical protein MAR_001904 [Mya arenaria]|uniref:Uncharacterized protein n=1 Tax=Mya arenaria TaxID=6604 RepID=A0ABY7FLG4_MYAAR|nr:hypothetical protein MAR_001904 [Mya arenaria]